MTLDDKTGSADRLTGASSPVAAKLQIHEMAVDNGVMQKRQLPDGLPIPAGGSVVAEAGQLSRYAARAEEAAHGRRNNSAYAYF